ncbi:MAG: CBS domain-containing protein [Planctomycetota bacterium]|jgi:acetoin utilization protein AcuB|nr:CBS domain-containing protein [Planctomycetota bacterium]MDP6503672.1 CBS domain-containing protein [Planctomycetota bacterium]
MPATDRKKILNVRSVMRNHVATVDINDSVQSVSRSMQQQGIHHMPVLEEGEIAGMVTHHDLEVITKSAGELADAADMIIVKAVMARPPITISPDTPLSEAIWVMVEHLVHSLPVMERGKLIGIITHTDVLTWAAEKLA